MNFLKTLSAVAILAAAALTHSTMNAAAGVTESKQFFATRTSGGWKTTGHAFVIDGKLKAACGIYSSLNDRNGDRITFAANVMVSDLLDKRMTNGAQTFYQLSWPEVSENSGGAIRVVMKYKINGVWKKFVDIWERDAAGGRDSFSLNIPYAVVSDLFRRASKLHIKVYTRKDTKEHFWLKLNMAGTDVSGEYQRQCASKFMKDMKR